MFNHNKKNNAATMDHSEKPKKRPQKNVSSVNMVSDGTEIIGTLKTQNDIRIAGLIDGEAQVNGKIIIASSGHVDGNVQAEDADIAGRVEGEIHASGKLTLRQAAVVKGDLYAQSLEVEEGATFNGACHMGEAISKNTPPADNDSSSTKAKDELAV